MTYKEFRAYCNNRACDGMWSLEEAMICINIIEKIESIKGFRKNKAKEKAWQELLNNMGRE